VAPAPAISEVEEYASETAAIPKTVTKEEQPKDEKSKKKKRSKKSAMITAGVAVLVMLISGAAVSYSGILIPKVDDTLVSEYLQKNGSVAGVTTDGAVIDEQAQSSQPSTDEVPSTAVPFDQTSWATVTEPIIGVSLQYPENAVKITKSESSLTFLRKEGYLFKIQKIDTGLDLQAYWDQVKTTTYEYEEEKSTLGSKTAIHLKLSEETKYPGDRYLVAVEDAVMDIWYATESEVFSKDDIRRVEVMLESIKFD
jgi:hypothetical protein